MGPSRCQSSGGLGLRGPGGLRPHGRRSCGLSPGFADLKISATYFPFGGGGLNVLRAGTDLKVGTASCSLKLGTASGFLNVGGAAGFSDGWLRGFSDVC